MTRYIDADALINRIVFHTHLPPNIKEILEDEVNEMPTADVRENDHGEWMYTKHYGEPYRVCPKCHMERKDDLSRGWNFCPNCGVSMEKGEKDG